MNKELKVFNVPSECISFVLRRFISMTHKNNKSHVYAFLTGPTTSLNFIYVLKYYSYQVNWSVRPSIKLDIRTEHSNINLYFGIL